MSIFCFPQTKDCSSIRGIGGRGNRTQGPKIRVLKQLNGEQRYCGYNGNLNTCRHKPRDRWIGTCRTCRVYQIWCNVESNLRSVCKGVDPGAQDPGPARAQGQIQGRPVKSGSRGPGPRPCTGPGADPGAASKEWMQGPIGPGPALILGRSGTRPSGGKGRVQGPRNPSSQRNRGRSTGTPYYCTVK